jgi:hypothetical protein
MLKSVKFTANSVLALDGIHPVAISKGEIRHDVPENIAESLLADGRATKVDAVAHETKSEGDDSSKPAKKAKKKKK